MRELWIGSEAIGAGRPVFVVAEIGINHNGDIDTALDMIDAAAGAGANAVKFQKRCIEEVYTEAYLALPRTSPFGISNQDLKYGLEFGREEYVQIAQRSKERGLIWYASPWDPVSADFLSSLGVVCYKVPSACLTDRDLLDTLRGSGRPVFLSTGMSSLEEIDAAVAALAGSPIVLLHCVSAYPASHSDLNLRAIGLLADRYDLPVGYSGHEMGTDACVVAVALGACMIERHTTLSRTMWGSDQAFSLEPDEFAELVARIRETETALGSRTKHVLPVEEEAMANLRATRP